MAQGNATRKIEHVQEKLEEAKGYLDDVEEQIPGTVSQDTIDNTAGAIEDAENRIQIILSLMQES